MSTVPHDPPTQVVTLGEVVSAFRRRRLTIVVFALLGVVISGIYAVASPQSYTATAVVALATIPDNPLSAGVPRAVNAATEAQVARSNVVATFASIALGGTATGSAIAGRVTVTAPLDTVALQISYRGTTPQAAADGANAVAQAYLTYRTQLTEDQNAATAKVLDAQVADLTRRLQAAQDAAGAVPGRAAIATAATEAGALSAVLERQREQRAQLDTAPVSAGTIVGRATPPSSSGWTVLLLVLAAGFAIGIVVGALVALVRDRLDRRIFGASQIESQLGVDVLAEVPVGGEKLARIAPYQRLAAILASERNRPGLESVLIAGVGDSSADHVAADVAAALVPHVDAVRLACAPAALQDNLAVMADWSLSDDEALRVVSFGPERTLRGGQRVLSLPAGAAAVIDGAHVEHASTAITLSSAAKTVLIVARVGDTRLHDLRGRIRDLNAAGATITGVILLLHSRTRRLRRSATKDTAAADLSATVSPEEAQDAVRSDPYQGKRPTPYPRSESDDAAQQDGAKNGVNHSHSGLLQKG